MAINAQKIWAESKLTVPVSWVGVVIILLWTFRPWIEGQISVIAAEEVRTVQAQVDGIRSDQKTHIMNFNTFAVESKIDLINLQIDDIRDKLYELKQHPNEGRNEDLNRRLERLCRDRCKLDPAYQCEVQL